MITATIAAAVPQPTFDPNPPPNWYLLVLGGLLTAALLIAAFMAWAKNRYRPMAVELVGLGVVVGLVFFPGQVGNLSTHLPYLGKAA